MHQKLREVQAYSVPGGNKMTTFLSGWEVWLENSQSSNPLYVACVVISKRTAKEKQAV